MQIIKSCTIITIFLFCICGFTGCIFKDAIRKSKIAAAEEAIAKDPEFRETDDLCRNIPLPEGTNFIEKERLFNSVGLSYYYYSNKKPEDLQNFFREYFTKNGWEPKKPDTDAVLTADFKNDKFVVYVTLTGITGDANFSVECEKLNTKRK